MSLDVLLALYDITELGLSAFSAGSGKLPNKGYTEANKYVPALGNETVTGHYLLVLSQNIKGKCQLLLALTFYIYINNINAQRKFLKNEIWPLIVC